MVAVAGLCFSGNLLSQTRVTGSLADDVGGLKDSTLYSGHKWNLIVRPWNNPSQQNPADREHLFPWSCYQTPWPTVPPYLFP